MIFFNILFLVPYDMPAVTTDHRQDQNKHVDRIIVCFELVVLHLKAVIQIIALKNYLRIA